MDTSQDEVFDNVAKPVIDSCLQGYNGTIFAYGQTGSGKTFTITGGPERYSDRGLIPRSLQYIFKRQKSSNISVAVSYLEIYNEIGYDLLDTTRDAKKLEDLPKVSLMEDSQERIHLKNLRVVPANSEEDALNLLFIGDTNRMIAETPSNPHSSRSHCIFIISLVIRDEASDTVRRARLHLVDLAGSERVAKTQIDGTLLREAKHINLSLHYLEQVIIALHEQSLGKRTHIPYRNSMMTSVLRDSLGGNCKTVMIATIAVEDVLIDESISTCRFAQRVALIANKAVLNEEVDSSMMLERYRKEIDFLKAELSLAKGTEMSDEPLDQEELDRVKRLVDDYLANVCDLAFTDFRKINYAYSIFKEYVLTGKRVASKETSFDTQGLTEQQVQQMEKMRHLITHRDNEINILVGMIAQLKQQIAQGATSHTEVPTPKPTYQPTIQAIEAPPTEVVERKVIQPSTSTQDIISAFKASVPRLTTEKAKAFDLFKSQYPSGEWIDRQKQLLRDKYAQAKALGESANLLRNEIKRLKECLQESDSSIRDSLPQKVSEYRQAYQQLKDLKIEIEHLQHLLEQARIRLTRDFEEWYVNVYQNSEDLLETVLPPKAINPPSKPTITPTLSTIITTPTIPKATMTPIIPRPVIDQVPRRPASAMSDSTISALLGKGQSINGWQPERPASVLDDVKAFYKARDQLARRHEFK